MIDIDKLLMDAKRKEEQVVLNLEIAILEAFIIALESIKNGIREELENASIQQETNATDGL